MKSFASVKWNLHVFIVCVLHSVNTLSKPMKLWNKRFVKIIIEDVCRKAGISHCNGMDGLDFAKPEPSSDDESCGRKTCRWILAFHECRVQRICVHTVTGRTVKEDLSATPFVIVNLSAGGIAWEQIQIKYKFPKHRTNRGPRTSEQRCPHGWMVSPN